MSDIADLLASLASDAEKATHSLESLAAAKTKALEAGDYKLMQQLEKTIKLVEKLTDAREKEAEAKKTIQDLQKKGTKLTKEENKSLEEAHGTLTDLVEAEEALGKSAKDAIKTRRKARQELIAQGKVLRENWKQTTLLGKSYGIMTSGLAKLTAGITAGTLAGKAWTRWVQAAEVRQQILIQNFKGFKETASDVEVGLLDTAKAALFGTPALTGFDTALRKAEGSAILMGVSTDYVAETMVNFSRITGSDNPEALSRLTQATITVSRTMGITMPEAVEFVQHRMDKFGGTAASAIVSMQNMRLATEEINDGFGRTVVRGDDVSRILLDISRATNVYAIDQRMVAGMLRENIARLQMAGDSYDLAARKAKAFADATVLQDKIPQFMKILAGGKLLKGMKTTLAQAAMMGAEEGGKHWEKHFGASLDAAAPGLSKKIKAIVADPDIGQFSKMQLIQELAKGSTVGMKAMNDQILNIAKGADGIYLLSEWMGISMEEAQGIAVQAEQQNKRFTEVGNALKMNADQLAKKYNISKEAAELALDENKSYGLRKKLVEDIISADEMSKLQAKQRREDAERELVLKEKMAAYETMKKATQTQIELVAGEPFRALQKEIEAQAAKIAEMDDGDEKDKLFKEMEANKEKLEGMRKEMTDAQRKNLDTLENQIRTMDEDIAQQAKKGDEMKIADMNMEQLTRKNLADFGEYSKLTAKNWEKLKSDMSTIPDLLTQAVGYLAVIAGTNILGGVMSRRGGGVGGGGAGGGKGKGTPKTKTSKPKGGFLKKMKGGGGKLGGLLKLIGIGAAGATLLGGDAEAAPAEAEAGADGKKGPTKATPKAATPTPKAPAMQGPPKPPVKETSLWGKFKGFASGAAKSVGEGASSLMKKGGDLAGKVVKGGSELAGKALKGGKELAVSALKSTGEALKGLGSLGKKVLGPVVKVFGKFTGLFAPIFVALQDFENILKSITDGDYVETMIRSIPAVLSGVGGVGGGIAGGAVGTLAAPGVGTAVGGVAGATGGAVAGEQLGSYIRDALLDWRDDPQDEKKKRKEPIVTKPSKEDKEADQKLFKLLSDKDLSDFEKKRLVSETKGISLAEASEKWNKLSSKEAKDSNKHLKSIIEGNRKTHMLMTGTKTLRPENKSSGGAPDKKPTKPTNIVKDKKKVAAKDMVTDKEGKLVPKDSLNEEGVGTVDPNLTDEGTPITEEKKPPEDSVGEAEVDGGLDDDGSILLRVFNFEDVVKKVHYNMAMKSRNRPKGSYN